MKSIFFNLLKTILVLTLNFMTFSMAQSAESVDSDNEENPQSQGQADIFRGRFAYSIPLEVPRFRKITPQLSLNYASSGENGPLGKWGWSIGGLSLIAHKKEDSKPRDYRLDGERLLTCTKFGGTHCTRSPTYNYIKKNSTSWTIKTKDGTVHTYTRLVPTGDTLYGISSIVDTNGNRVNYTWIGARIKTISYGPNNYAKIVFEWGTRPDKYSRGTGDSYIEVNHRIVGIRVESMGNRVRRYEMVYANNRLASVQEYGRSNTAPLPPTTFEYRLYKKTDENVVVLKLFALKEVTNSLGGRTSIGYRTVKVFRMTHILTARTITVDDGRGEPTSVATTTYNYGEKKYIKKDVEKHIRHEFMGFGYVESIQPAGANQPGRCTKTWHKLDLQNLGRIREAHIVEGDCSGTLRQRTVHTWENNLETATQTYIFDNGRARRKKVTRWHDGHGNVTREFNYGKCVVSDDGEVNGDCTGGDEFLTLTNYGNNYPAFIVGLPYRVRLFKGTNTAGAMLSDTLFYYDGSNTPNSTPTKGNLTRVARRLDRPNSWVSKYFTYDGRGNKTSATDEEGAETQFVYDATFPIFRTKVINPLGQQNITWWNVGCGKPATEFDRNGNRTTHTYDNLCRHYNTTFADGGYKWTRYYDFGDPRRQYIRVYTRSPAGGHLWKSTYMDGLGRTWAKVSNDRPSNRSKYFYYNEFGQVYKKNHLGKFSNQAHQFEHTYYDVLDRPYRTVLPDGKERRKVYYSAGVTDRAFSQVNSSDEMGHNTAVSFDTFGHVVRRYRQKGSTWLQDNYYYNGRGDLVRTDDPAGNIWLFGVDSLGRRHTRVDPDSGTSRYTYDKTGRLIRTIFAKGNRVNTRYDKLGRKTREDAVRANGSVERRAEFIYDQVSSGYSNIGKLTYMSDDRSEERFYYDKMGRKKVIRKRVDGKLYVTRHSYYSSGDLHSSTMPNGIVIGPRTYTAAGQPKAIPGYVYNTYYNAEGKPTQINFANGTYETRSYSDTRGWLNSQFIRESSTGAEIDKLIYQRNNEGHVTTVQAKSSVDRREYSYDTIHRLILAENPSRASYNTQYTYDNINNITGIIRSNGASANWMSYGLGSAGPHAITSLNGSHYSYDANGQLTSGGGRTITWGSFGLPSRINNTFFHYDGNNARVRKNVNGVVTHYMGDHYEVKTPNTNTEKATAHITHGGMIVAKNTNGAKTWLYTDHNQSIYYMRKGSSGNGRRSYLPYGEKYYSTGTAPQEPLGWISQRQDETGLFYLHARYYDPRLGRFISADPSDPDKKGVGTNPYAYGDNNPVMNKDPDGLAFHRTTLENNTMSFQTALGFKSDSHQSREGTPFSRFNRQQNINAFYAGKSLEKRISMAKLNVQRSINIGKKFTRNANIWKAKSKMIKMGEFRAIGLAEKYGYHYNDYISNRAKGITSDTSNSTPLGSSSLSSRYSGSTAYPGDHHPTPSSSGSSLRSHHGGGGRGGSKVPKPKPKPKPPPPRPSPHH